MPGERLDWEMDEPKPGRGLGDLVAWVAARLGIHGWTGCGCERRRAWLNRHTYRILHALLIIALAVYAILKFRG